MALEIEVKMRLADPEAMRARLTQAGARRLGCRLEENIYFDSHDDALRRGDRGLRIRIARDESGRQSVILTFKGPRRPGPMKIREEAELATDSPASAEEFVTALGFRRTLSFQKRRESWELAGAKVELDELPELGRFIEIEGPDEKTVQAVREQLGLADTLTVTESYIALVAAHLGGRCKELRFG